jgi:hypothetical protein
MAPPKPAPLKKKVGKSRNGLIAEYEKLIQEAKENPWRLFDVNEIRVLFRIGEKQMTRLRKLSAKDFVDTGRKNDPWGDGNGTVTRPERFADWYWGRRVDLEEKYKSI